MKKICSGLLKSGTQCTREGDKSGYCWQHGGKSRNIKKTKKKKIKKKPTKPKLRSSIWLFTLNTNKDFRKLDLTFKKKFEKLCKFLFEGNHICDFVVDSRNPGVKIEDNENIKTCDTQFQLEIGSKFHKFHSHAILKIEHTGNLTFEANKLRKFMYKLFGYNLHLDSTVSSDHALMMRRYVEKSEKLNLE